MEPRDPFQKVLDSGLPSYDLFRAALIILHREIMEEVERRIKELYIYTDHETQEPRIG